MKTKQTILKAFASLALAMGAFASANAQTNLGADCGCPPVASRTTVVVSSATFPQNYTSINGTYGAELTKGANFTCNNTYILTEKVYIPEGKILNIAPGTVIKGRYSATPAAAAALVIERGGKIFASGTESCPIVFTAEDDLLNGAYPVYNTGMWGGVVILGKASNNLTLAANGPFIPGGAGKLAVADGLGTVEGFASSNPQDQYGTATSIPGVYTSSTSPNNATYTFQLTVVGTSSSGGFQRFNVSKAVSTYMLNGMTFTDGATTNPITGTITAVGSTSSTAPLLNTVTTNISGGTFPSTATTLTFTGTYPLTPGTTASFYNASVYPTSIPSDAALLGHTIMSGNTGPVVNGFNYAIPFLGTTGTADDNDNSGIMKYVSIRHAGAILAVGAEINGLTLASVGSGTTIDHIEIVSCADDNVEIFGGTVNLKYITMLFGNDDMLDYDLGWKGKAQFIFGMKNTGPNASTGLGSPDNDNGIEADSDDNTSNNASKSTPVMYNVTMIGNGKATGTSDNRGVAAVQFKEGTQGKLYNSIFANFKNGVNLQVQSGTRVGDSYEYWGSGALEVKCNSFVGIGGTAAQSSGTIPAIENNYLVKNASSLGSVGEQPTPADTAKFLVTDLNTAYFNRAINYTTQAVSNYADPIAIPGFSYAFTISATNSVSVKNDVTPNPVLSTAGCPTAPVDGFFEPAAYRGAFSSQAGKNWLSNWTYSKVLGASQGVAACPTDLNGDGVTNVSDFNIFAPAFGTTCN